MLVYLSHPVAFLLAICVLVASPLATVAKAATPIPVYGFGGQSNMTGFLGSVGTPADVPNPNSSVMYQHKVTAGTTIVESSGWVDMQTVWATGGSELSFADEMAERTGQPLAVVKVAANGTSLFVEWSLAEPTSWYFQMKDKLQLSFAQLEALDYAPYFAGFFWAQGEGDATVSFRADAYETNLTNFIAQLRTDFSEPNLPFYFNRLHAEDNLSQLSTVRQAQQTVASSVPNTRLLDIDDIEIGPDLLHLTANAQIELGRRWADFVSPSADFDYDNDVDLDDLVLWQTSYGTSDYLGDANSDNAVDGKDFLLWQQQYLPPSTLASVIAVPEPTGIVVASIALSLITAYVIYRCWKGLAEDDYDRDDD